MGFIKKNRAEGKASNLRTRRQNEHIKQQEQEQQQFSIYIYLWKLNKIRILNIRHLALRVRWSCGLWYCTRWMNEWINLSSQLILVLIFLLQLLAFLACLLMLLLKRIKV